MRKDHFRVEILFYIVYNVFCITMKMPFYRLRRRSSVPSGQQEPEDKWEEQKVANKIL